MPLDLISVKEATETYGYSGSHIRNLLAKGMIEGEKIAGVWLVDPNSLNEHQARMERLGNKKHGTWAKTSADKGAELAALHGHRGERGTGQLSHQGVRVASRANGGQSAMNPDRFQDSSAGQLVKVREGDLAYWAFVPYPLPPKIEPDWALTHTLSEADRALSELAGVGRTMPNPHLLIGPFMRREAVLSSRIEGTRADVTDLYAYQAGQLSLPGMAPAPPEADVREVHNYVRALEYGLERLETLPVSLRLIREIHQRLLEGVRGERATPGEFRDRQNWLGPGESTLEDATFVPPPVPQMQEALYALEEYLHSDDVYPPLVRLAMMHYQFEVIHPFIDGNGRVGRLLISLLLVNWGLLPQPLLYLSVFFFRHRQDYYDLLLAVSERGAWTEWMLFFLRGVAEQSHDAVARARRLQDLRAEWHDRLTEARASALLLQLADHIFDSPVITIPQAQEVLDVTYHTAQRHVQRLVEADILHQAGDADYGRTFVAGEILDAIGAD